MSYIEEKIARAIIGACGTDGTTEGSLLSARRQAERVVKALGLVQFYSVDYGDGEMAELTWEHWDEARDHAAEGFGDDTGDSKIVTGWFTGWEPAENVASLT
jgi:hypothetical protein